MIEEDIPTQQEDGYIKERLRSYVTQQFEQAWLGATDIRRERQDNLELYENRNTKDQPAGNRSKAQTSDISDNVNWILDEIMDLLYSVGSPVEFVPSGANDIKEAKQETASVTHEINQENEGFLIIYQWVKDALIQKNGTIKVYWDNKVREELETYEDVSHAQFLKFLEDPQVTVEQQTLYINGVEQEQNIIPPIDINLPPIIQQQQLANRLQGFTHDVKLRRKTETGKVVLENIAPENFFVRRNQTSLDISEALFCSQRERKTRGELIQDGYDPKIIMDLPIYSDVLGDEEAASRYWKEGANLINYDNNTDNELAQEVEVWEAYCFYDLYGDNKLRLVQVIMGGGKNGEILSYDEVDSIPFISMTPEINSYRYFGTCPADRTKQIQRIKTAVTRQILDNLYAHNNPQLIVNLNKLDDQGIESIKDIDIGAPIYVREDGAVTYQSTPFMAADSLPILQLFDDMAERRTGVSKVSQGLDPAMLKDQSMYIGAKMMSQSQKKVLFLARTMAETGFRWLYQKVHELLSKHCDKGKILEVNGEYIEVYPRNWRKRTSMRIMIGTGNNTNEQKLLGLQQVTQFQQKIVEGGGMGTLISAENLFNTAQDIVELMGLKDVSRYFMNPAKAPPPPPPEPEPALQLGMADIQAKKDIAMVNAQLEKYKVDQSYILDKQKMIQDSAIEQKKIDLQKERMRNE